MRLTTPDGSRLSEEFVGTAICFTGVICIGIAKWGFSVDADGVLKDEAYNFLSASSVVIAIYAFASTILLLSAGKVYKGGPGWDSLKTLFLDFRFDRYLIIDFLSAVYFFGIFSALYFFVRGCVYSNAEMFFLSFPALILLRLALESLVVLFSIAENLFSIAEHVYKMTDNASATEKNTQETLQNTYEIAQKLKSRPKITNS